MANLKDLIVTGPARFVGPLYADGSNITNINANNIASGTLVVSRGGTGKTTNTANSVLVGNGTSAVKNITSASGALYATAANGEPVFGTLPIAQGGTAKTTHTANSVLVGNGTSALKNIASASGALYATAANGEPVFGTLPTGQGGTGKTTINKNSLVYGDNTGALKEVTASGNTPKGVVYYSAANTAPSIVSELPVSHGGSGVNTITADGLIIGNGTSAFTALTPAKGAVYYTADKKPAIISELPVSHGGTGKNTNTANSVLVGNGASALKNIASASGALYATAANGEPKFGTLPVAQGGTGATDAAGARTNLGLGSVATYTANSSVANNTTIPTGAAVVSYVSGFNFGSGSARDNTKVLKAGDTMTGALTLSGDPTANLHAVTKQYSDKRAIIPVKGTQTAVTGSWTGSIPVDALYDGLTIAYYLPYAGSGDATLNLTLSGGGTTGAIPVYRTATSRLTTHYGAGSTIYLTYWSAGSISVSGTATTENRWTSSDYDSNTDTKVRQTLQTDNNNRPLLMSYQTISNTTANVDNVSYRNNGIYANPSTGTITATTFSGNLTGNVTGTASNASALTGFKVTSSTNLGIDSTTVQNEIGYVSGLTKADWNSQQTDGALYKQVYSASWIHEIFGDYRTGHIAVRGRNNGTWTSWNLVADSGNISDANPTLAWSTKSKVATIAGVDINVTMPANPNWTSHLYVGTGTAANAATTNGNTKIVNTDNSTVRNTIVLKGGSGIGVTSDASANITVAHTNSITAGTAKGEDGKTLTFGGTFKIPTVTYDAQGHITGTGSVTMTMPANPNTNTWRGIQDNLTSDSTTDSLSAKQGKVLKGLVDDLDSNKVAKAGDTMTGTLTIGSSSQSAFPTVGIAVHDVRSVDFTPGALDKGANFFFSNKSMPNTNWWSGLHVKGWTGGYSAWEIAGPSHDADQRTTALYVRSSNKNTAWGSWRKIYDSSNPPTYSEVGAAAASHGNHVPATQTANNAIFLRNDNTWQTVTPANIGAATSGHTHTLSLAADSGTSSISLSANTKYKLTAGGSTYIFTTPADTNTKVTSVGNHYTPAEDTQAVLEANASSSTAATWNSTSLVTGVTLKRDAKGHVVGVAVDSIKMPANPNTNTWIAFVGASASAAGTAGYVPAPGAGNQNKFFRGDGTWQTPTDTNNAVTQTATTTNANYEVLFSVTADNTTRTEGARKNSNLTFNPSTGNLNVTQINGVTVGTSPKFTDNNTWIAFAGATASAAGTAGYVPAPGAGNQGKFFRGDGTWATPTDTNNAVTQTATTTSADYEVLFSATADNTTRTEGARKNSNLTFNPNTGNLAVTQINGVEVGSSPKFTDTNTHYTTHLYAGASNGNANATTTNGNTYLIVCDNTSARNRIKLAGSGGTTVTSDDSGNITINSTASSSTTIRDNLTGNGVTNAALSANQGYLLANGSARDDTKVLKAGDTMTGSLAIGANSEATGTLSHAQGAYCTASGNNSHATGNYTEASGDSSHAEGGYTKAIGTTSHAEGYMTTANGVSSRDNGAHAEGNSTSAYGDGSHAEGSSSIASGGSSHAEGWKTSASGSSSHAEGVATSASGSRAHAEGYYCTASGNYSHAEGQNTLASKVTSHAEGYYCTASGSSSHAEGGNTRASGSASHAEGYLTTASGAYSHASGSGTCAYSEDMFVCGSYNDTSINAVNPLFVVGNGTSNTARSNALVVSRDSSLYAGTSNPTSSGINLFYKQTVDGQTVNESNFTQSNYYSTHTSAELSLFKNDEVSYNRKLILDAGHIRFHSDIDSSDDDPDLWYTSDISLQDFGICISGTNTTYDLYTPDGMNAGSKLVASALYTDSSAGSGNGGKDGLYLHAYSGTTGYSYFHLGNISTKNAIFLESFPSDRDASNTYYGYVMLAVNSTMRTFAPTWTGSSTGIMSLGYSQFPWKQVYASNTAISTSDERLKENIEEFDDNFIKKFITGIRPVKFKFKTGDRTHYGMIAQDIEKLLDNCGLSSMDFGGFCKDILTGTESPTGEKPLYDDLYSLRYEEFISPLIKMVQIQQREIDELKNTINELISKIS